MAGSPVGASMGSKVVQEVKDALKAANLNIKTDETGGSNIRSMLIDIEAGNVDVK